MSGDRAPLSSKYQANMWCDTYKPRQKIKHIEFVRGEKIHMSKFSGANEVTHRV